MLVPSVEVHRLVLAQIFPGVVGQGHQPKGRTPPLSTDRQGTDTLQEKEWDL